MICEENLPTDLAGADGEYPDFLGLNSRFGGVDTTDSAALCFPLVGVVVTEVKINYEDYKI